MPCHLENKNEKIIFHKWSITFPFPHWNAWSDTASPQNWIRLAFLIFYPIEEAKTDAKLRKNYTTWKRLLRKVDAENVSFSALFYLPDHSLGQCIRLDSRKYIMDTLEFQTNLNSPHEKHF